MTIRKEIKKMKNATNLNVFMIMTTEQKEELQRLIDHHIDYLIDNESTQSDALITSIYNAQSCSPDDENETKYKMLDEILEAILPDENEKNEYIKSKKTPHYMLIATDGYSIESTTYDSLEACQNAMKTAYNELNKNEPNDEWDTASHMNATDALLYAGGENVYVWLIEKT